MKSLEEFLAPVSAAEFLREIYGAKPCHIPGHSVRFSHLLPWDTINTIIAQHRMQHPRLRLAKEGKIVDVKAYLTSKSAEVEVLNLSALGAQLREGAMLVIDAIEETYAPIAGISRMLERELGEIVQMNAYAGWYSSQGFDTHWDDHDVFIIQVAGRKHWRVFEPQRKHPVSQDKALKLPPPTANPIWEADLKAGDMLYIPRGWWHDAVPVGEPTLHLTAAIPRKTGFSLVNELVEKLREHEVIRTDLPRFASQGARDRYMKEFRAAINTVVDQTTVEDHLRTLDTLAQARVRTSFPWSAMPEAQGLGELSWLHWLPPRKVAIEESEGQATLEAMGSKFGFEKVAAPVLHTLADEVHIRFDRLCEKHTDVTPEALGRFTIRLVSSGLLTLSENDSI